MTKRGPGFAAAKRRAVGFLEYTTGAGVGETGGLFTIPRAPRLVELLGGVPGVADRLYLIAAPPAAWGSWARAGNLPDGWSHAGRGHHLPRDSTTTPSLRFTRPDGRELELRNAAEWFGDASGAESAATCSAAWRLLAWQLARTSAGGELLASPSQTGRDVLTRCLPRGQEFPLLEPSVRELIASTSQQGRVELLPAARKMVPGLVELDARTAYGACLRSLGSGPVVHDEVPELPLDARGRLTARCRLLVTVTVPAGWAHLGIFSAPGKPYRYPSTPGERFETWADGWEVQVALDHGWSVRVLERIIFTPGNPLDGWAKLLRGLVQSCEASPEPGAQLAARAVRNMLVGTVGAFAQTGYRVTHTTTDAEKIPTGATFTQDEAGGFVWEERRALTGSAATFSHPEWAAQVWARARVRLLSTPVTKAYPQATGALHVPFERVVALRTDALYLTADPQWPDDGEWGRYRLKGALPKARKWPENIGRLLELRNAGRTELDRLQGAHRG